MPTESGSDGAAHTVVLDVDGTLVDSNYQHSVAWFRAFRRHGVTPSVWRIHRAIGMGGDRLVAAVAGDEVESRCGDEVRAAWEQEYAPYLPEVCALDGARLLLERLHEHGCTVVLASSGKPDHIEHYLDLLDARRLADTWTTAQDAEQTKPAPDLLTAALERVEVRGSVVTVGDSTWDVLASRELGYDTHCVLTGGFSAAELERAGAVGVHEDLHALWAALEPTLNR